MNEQTVSPESVEAIVPAEIETSDDELERYLELIELQSDPLENADGQVFIIGSESWERMHNEREFYLRPSRLDIYQYRERIEALDDEANGVFKSKFHHARVDVNELSRALLRDVNITVPEYVDYDVLVYLPEIDIDFLIASGVAIQIEPNYGIQRRDLNVPISSRGGAQTFYEESFESSGFGSDHAVGHVSEDCEWDRVSCNSSDGLYSVWCADNGSDCETGLCTEYVNNMETWVGRIDDITQASCYVDIEFSFMLSIDFYNLLGGNDMLQRYEDLGNGSGYVVSAVAYNSNHSMDEQGWFGQLFDYNGPLPYYKWEFYFISNSVGNSAGVYVDDLQLSGIYDCGGGSTPDNDECSGSNPVEFPVLQAGTTVTVSDGEDIEGATQSQSPSTNCGTTSVDAFDVWFEFEATCEDHVITVNPSSQMDAALALHTSCGGSAVACSDDQGGNDEDEFIDDYTFNPGSTYYVRVYDYNNSNGSGSYPSTTTFDISIETPSNCGGCVIPNEPSGLSASAISSSEILVSWNDNSGVETEYQLEYSTSSNGPWTTVTLNANDESETVDNLSANTTYYFRVRACCNSTCSDWEDGVSETTDNGGGSCSDPNASVSNESGASPVTLTCNTSGGSGGTIMYRWYNGNSCSGGQIGTGPTYQATSTGTYSCKAYIQDFENECWDCDAGTATITTPCSTPNSPSGFSATATSSSTIYLSWNDNSNNETEFELRYSTTPLGPWNPISLNPNTENYTYSGLNANTAYYFELRVCCDSQCSSFQISDATTDADPCSTPASPSAFSAVATSSSSINITWNDNSNNETVFELAQSTTPLGPWNPTTISANEEDYDATGLNAGTTYHYRLRACCNSMCSSWLTPVDATTTGGTCIYNLSPSSNNSVPLIGVSSSFDVTTASTCTWSASTNDDWISIISNSGTGNGQVQYSVEANESPNSRSGSISIEGELFEVVQQANPVPSSINSPLPSPLTESIISVLPPSPPSNLLSILQSNHPSHPGLKQSTLHSDLYDLDLNDCPEQKNCFDCFIHTPAPSTNDGNTTPNELVAKAGNCFIGTPISWSDTWKFRQRGPLTEWSSCGISCSSQYPDCHDCGNPATEMYNTICCSNSFVTHSETACYGHDDRRAWDANLSVAESGICVFAVEDGVIMNDFNQDGTAVPNGYGNEGWTLRHTNINGDNWFSGYNRIVRRTGLDIGDEVYKNQCIGHILDFDGPLTTKEHLHFAVYYNEGNRLVSVDRPIIPDFSFDFQFEPVTNIQYYSGSAYYEDTNIELNLTNSYVSGARLKFKKEGQWMRGRLSDENGKVVFRTIPALQIGDSISIECSGFRTIYLAIDDNLESQKDGVEIPMIPDYSSNPSILYPVVRELNPQAFYGTAFAEVSITGENFDNFDVERYTVSEGGEQIEMVLENQVPADSVVSLPLLPGDNTFRITYDSPADTVIVFKSLRYVPNAPNTYVVNVNSSPEFVSTKIYLNGRYLKEISSTVEPLSLESGVNLLSFYKLGYMDTTYTVDGNSTINVSLQEVPIYSASDSCVINFPVEGSLQYRCNVTLLDSVAESIISMRQFEFSYDDISLVEASRSFEFRNITQNSWSNIEFHAVLDDADAPTVDSTYLLVIHDDSLFTKYSFDSAQATYEENVQKLDFAFVNFNEGQAEKETLVMMRKQHPILSSNVISMAEDIPVSLGLDELVEDPDSIPDDLSILLSGFGQGISVSIQGDSIFFIPDTNYHGSSDITLTAEHDWLVSTFNIPIDIEPVNDAPQLEALNPTQFCTGSSSGTISLNTFVDDVDNPLSELNFTVSVESVDVQNATLQDLQYSLDPNNDLVFTTTFNDSATFMVSIVANDGDLNSVVQTFNVDVNHQPVAEIFASGGLEICESEGPVVLTATTGDSYEWSNGETTQSVDITSSESLSVIVTNPAGCAGEATSDVVSVEVTENPLRPTVTGGQSCENEDIQLTASTIPNVSYYWEGPDFVSTDQNPLLTGVSTSHSGDYNVYAIFDGCSSLVSLPAVVTVFENPQTEIIANGSLVLCGDSVQLTANGSSGTMPYSYSWSNGEITESIMINSEEAGNYQVSIVDANNCHSLASDVITVTSESPTAPQISAAGDTELCYGESLVLNTSTSGNILWSNGLYGQSTTITAPGTYTAQVQGQNCMSSNSNSISVDFYDAPDMPSIQLADTCLLRIEEIANATYQWYHYDNEVGNNTRYHDANTTGPGFYYVIVTNEYDCSSQSPDFHSSCVLIPNSIDELDNRMFVVPNPSKGRFELVLQQAIKNGIYEVFDNIGQLVLSGDISTTHTIVDMESFAEGFYTVQITDANRTLMVERIVLTN